MTTLTSPTARTSGLYVRSPEGEQLVFPLKHTEVLAQISGNLSRVEVSQKFENPFTKPLEAVYIFPLPAEAAVDEMEIKIGDRTIKGSIKKREEAQRIYEKAKQEGRTAGLLEQERDNIFTQSLANIKPGEEIEVTIRYTDSLKFLAGDYEFVFPMVVGPRYIPGTPLDETTASGSAPAPMTVNADTDLVPDASRLNAPILPPGMRSGHDIGVTLEIAAGVPIRNVNSPSHQLQIEYFDSPQTSTASEQTNGLKVRVQLGNADTIPNKDLIVRYQISGRETQSTVLTQADDRGGHFAVYLIPAIEYKTDEIVPKDVVFLVDTSGSQSGAPLRQCKALLRQFINGLNPADTFSILDFSDKVRRLSQQPLPNTAENREQAIAYINKLHADNSTEMLGGIRAAIDFPAPSGRLRTVVFLSDGYIGNENQVLAEVQQHLKSGNRLYSFGAGSSVNRFLLDRIAEIGHGFSRIITNDEPVNEFVEKFFRQINNPVLVNLEITWQGEGENPVIYPSIAPDLFAEQPLVLFGKKGDCQAGKLQIKGVSAGGHEYIQTYEMNFTDPGNPAVAQLWGRHRIKDLMNQMVQYETKVGVETVTETALTYQLLSQYTAFVALSDDVRVEPGIESIAMNVPVEMPEGVEYEGVFGNTDFMVQKRILPSAAGPSAPARHSRPSAPAARSMQYLASDEESEEEIDASERATSQRDSRLLQGGPISLSGFSQQAKEGVLKKLNLILKADVQGSLEAIVGALRQLPQKEVQLRLLLSAPGEITETDVDLAAASNAVIVGFNTTLASRARQAADQAGVEVREYSVIYKLLDDIQGAMEGLLEPELVEAPLGEVAVRAVFAIGYGAVAGCMVLSGKVIRNCKVRVRRGNNVIYEGVLDSLKRRKEDAKEVNAGYECGISLNGFSDWAESDLIEAYRMVTKRRTLSQ